jgi:antitoxin component HigA of HigAB toxin-antitoxin module
MSKKGSTYYKDTMPRLVSEYKKALEECLKIVGSKIDIDINDDKMFNVLKGKKEAGEQVKFYCKEIEAIENEINDVHIVEEVKPSGAERLTTE